MKKSASKSLSSGLPFTIIYKLLDSASAESYF